MGIDYDRLELELRTALGCSLQLLLQISDLKSIGVFGLYTSEEMSYLNSTASAFPVANQTGSFWSPPDWKFHLFADQTCFSLVEAEMLKGWDADFTTFQIDKGLVFDVCVKALIRKSVDLLN